MGPGAAGPLGSPSLHFKQKSAQTDPELPELNSRLGLSGPQAHDTYLCPDMTAGDPTVAMEIIDIRQLHSPQNKHTTHTLQIDKMPSCSCNDSARGSMGSFTANRSAFYCGSGVFHKGFTAKRRFLESSALLCHYRLRRVFLCLTTLHNKLKGLVSEKQALVTINIYAQCLISL